MSRNVWSLTVSAVLVMCMLPFLAGQGCPGPGSSDPPAGGESTDLTDGSTDTGGNQDGNTGENPDGDTGENPDGDTSPPAESPSMAGTWTGQITVVMRTARSTTGPADVDAPDATVLSASTQITTTIDANGVPSSLPVVGAASSSGPGSGQTSAMTAGQSKTIVINGVTMTVQCKEAIYTPTHTRVVFEVTSYAESVSNGVLVAVSASSTQTFDITLSADGNSLAWNQTSEGASSVTATDGVVTEGEWLAQVVEQTGSLAKQ